jgi:hypothetical protein
MFGLCVLEKNSARNLLKRLKISNLWITEKNKKGEAVMVDEHGGITSTGGF